MKLFLLAVAMTLCSVVSGETYTDKYDSLDLDEILSNSRLFKAYVNCMLDKGKCTAEGRELKSHITDALENGCAKCTSAQRKGVRQVFKHMVTKESGVWRQLVDKYDPSREYSRKYESEFNIRNTR